MELLFKRSDKDLKTLAIRMKEMIDEGYAWERISHVIYEDLDDNERLGINNYFKELTGVCSYHYFLFT